MMRFSRMVAVAAALCSVAPAFAQDKQAFDTGSIPSDHILVPDGDLKGNVVLISDAKGWGATEETRAKALLDEGIAVIGLDLPTYLKGLKPEEGDDCIYTISDIESLAHQIQRAANSDSYRPPILAGIGEGGAMALAMIAQSPDATIGDAIAVDPLDSIPLTTQLCTPAEKETRDGRMIYGLTDGPLPAPVTVIFTPQANKAGRDHVADLVKDHSDIATRDTTDAPDAALEQALSDQIAAASASESDDPLGLPLTLLPTTAKYDTMAIFYSGDGGWRDIDKQIGAELQDQGIPVVGVDALRYFWSKRTPEETAEDLARIIDTYRRQWKVKHVLLAGYSFGADVIPAAYNLLSQQNKDRVTQITLLALSRNVDYEISVQGWLGVDSSTSSGDSLKDIAKIDPKRVQCIYGTEEDDDPCVKLKASGVEAIPIEGGHHFDEDYEALANKIVTSLKTRLGR
ncbi:type IV secretory pathway protein AcvB [Xaviernesmea oryzae]|uniref:Type IV secretory pathway protein AcvB n=1 Tax=Xaviernesmea oryzae TaxID=464029 RepID=A0A1Q9AUJ0_9HYPH|nr:AcvB/VirJ family lysyl-phosphatidylglycerol hydrolase [Xaviernesmea oryzae]OLP59120.1 type IV secretory pathway protein AcvB [Xaviernesmea oryzae]SEK85705.1 Type IV secretory pathway, VirJ component [Xaviernesmea oryzae]